MFVFSALITGQIWYAQSYYKEDFQNTIARQGSPTTEFPEGWRNVNMINIVEQGNNKLVGFYNIVENEIRTLESPVLNIKPSTKMALKLAYSVPYGKPIDGFFSIYAIENDDYKTKKLVKKISYSELIKKNNDFEKHPVSDIFLKEIPLTEYADKNIRFEFEILSPIERSIIYFDEIELIVDETLSTKEQIDNTKNIEVYPNPTTDFINFKNITLPAEAKIYTIDGKLVYNQNVVDRINLSHFTAGSYILQIKDKSGKKYTSKIVKK